MPLKLIPSYKTIITIYMLIFDKTKALKNDSYAFIMIHGYGGNKDSMKPLLNLLSFKEDVSFYFLQAPYAIKNNSYSWSYEIKPGVWEREEPKKLLNQFFDENIFSAYRDSNVFLFGFSQGAFICFEYGLNIQNAIGGIFPIAGFKETSSSIHPSQIYTPLIIGHGVDDDVIDVSSSEEAYNYYTNIKKMKNVKLITYKGKHKIGLKYLKVVNQTMKQNKIR